MLSVTDTAAALRSGDCAIMHLMVRLDGRLHLYAYDGDRLDDLSHLYTCDNNRLYGLYLYACGSDRLYGLPHIYTCDGDGLEGWLHFYNKIIVHAKIIHRNLPLVCTFKIYVDIKL